MNATNTNVISAFPGGLRATEAKKADAASQLAAMFELPAAVQALRDELADLRRLVEQRDASPARQPDDDLITVDEAAKILRIERKAIYRAIASGSFPCVKVGRSLRIRRRDLRGR